MLKLRSFLIVCAVSPWFLSGFQLPVEAQLSRGTAGTTSGGGTTGSGGVGGLTNPTNPSTDNNGVVITPGDRTSFNNAASLLIPTLAAAGGAGAALLAIASGPALSTFGVQQALTSGALTSIQTAVASGAGTSLPLVAFLGAGMFTISSSNATFPPSITFTSPDLKITTITVASGTANPSGAIAAVAAVLAAGGTQAQALMAGAIAGASTGINPVKVAVLVARLSGLFSGVSSLPVSIPTASVNDSSTLLVAADVTSLRVKSLNYEKGLMIAQGKGVSVNVEKLNQSILAYNDLIDSSTPEGVIALSKNPEFIVIGDTLRKLSTSIRG